MPGGGGLGGGGRWSAGEGVRQPGAGPGDNDLGAGAPRAADEVEVIGPAPPAGRAFGGHGCWEVAPHRGEKSSVENAAKKNP